MHATQSPDYKYRSHLRSLYEFQHPVLPVWLMYPIYGSIVEYFHVLLSIEISSNVFRNDGSSYRTDISKNQPTINYSNYRMYRVFTSHQNSKDKKILQVDFPRESWSTFPPLQHLGADKNRVLSIVTESRYSHDANSLVMGNDRR